jgi:ribosomal protein L24E
MKVNPMKARSLFTAVAMIAVLAVSSYAADEIKLDGVKCIMNSKKAANADKSTSYKDGKVFFCCGSCCANFVKKVKAGDKLVAAKGNAQLVATKQAKQTKCPFSGKPCKPGNDVKVAGATVHLCCKNCQAKANKMSDDDRLLAVLSDEAFKKANFTVKKD